jgi:hypothetical protein
MVDRNGLRLVGFIFAGVTFAVMLTTTMVVKGYSDGVYSLESAAIVGEHVDRSHRALFGHIIIERPWK